MRLIIAEKPSQARSIAKALNIQGKQRQGSIWANDTVITWCIGHLVSLAMPEDYDPSLKSWRLDSLPIIPEQTKLKAVNSTRDQWQVVKSLLQSPQFTIVINAADSGREGELIFDNVYRLSESKLPVQRLWTASLTDDALRLAFSNLKPSSQFKGLRDAARCRAEADWLIGLNITRLETLSAQAHGKEDGVYPVGRVQTPTLALIVAKEQDIKNFETNDYWILHAEFKQQEHQYKGMWFHKDQTKLETEEKALQLKEKILNKHGKISKFEEREEKQKPQLLYDLTTLQREANIRFAFSADYTLTICQSLYETHKVISYPRTSSRYLTESEGKQLPGILEGLKAIPAYKNIIEGKTFKKTPSRIINAKMVEDHHGIIPTGQLPKSSMTVDEKKIFDMVFRRTLASFYTDRVDFVTKIETTVEGETFRTRGRIIRVLGWWAINPMTQKEEKDILLPAIDPKGSVLTINGEFKKGKTMPPPRFTEASLLKKMETAGKDINDPTLREAMKQSGLGTPATRASIIEGLKSRKLIQMDKKSISPTPKGIRLISQIPDGPLKSASLTGEWEKKLNLMAKGEYQRSEFMSEIKELTKFLTSIRSQSIIKEEIKTQGFADCPKCKQKLLLKKYQAFNYVKCSNTECSIKYSSDTQGVPSGGYCNNKHCNGPVNKTKQGFLICVKCNNWQNSFPKNIIGDCPKCEKGQLDLRNYKGQHYVKCTSCELSYSTTSKGISQGGQCQSCKGPLKLTKNGHKVCVLCQTWVNVAPQPPSEKTYSQNHPKE